jgi:hypothetical protein
MHIENVWCARKFEYLGEFETKIESILGGSSGAQIGSFGQSVETKKSHASVPLNV